jgi:hypothetical protein
MTEPRTIKIWCDSCRGSGKLYLNSPLAEPEICGFCRGNGYTPLTYTLSNAVADAAVWKNIDAIDTAMDDNELTMLNDIAHSIVIRLHNFYCEEPDKETDK